MKYLSVCSGIEAATCAWHHMGWQPVGFSEIEPFPSAVLAHHYPDVPNLGDMTKYKEWNVGTIDLLVGGTPCQSFSVAGLRKGLEDPRGNLALVYCGILDHFKPRWFVWENVPGVLSSNGGRDFGSFLGAVAELGYGFAYRVLDAQYFGVAQRRRRVFVVGRFGDWRPAAEVLFEPSCLSGNSKPCRKKREKTAGRITHGLGSGGECARSLTAAQTATGRLDPHEATFISEMKPVGVPEVMSTLLSSTAGISRPSNAATEHETYIPMAQPMVFHGARYQINRTTKPEDGWFEMTPPAFVQTVSIPGAQSFVKSFHKKIEPIPLDLRNAGRDPEKHDEINRQGVGIGNPGDPSHTVTSACVHGVAQPMSGCLTPEFPQRVMVHGVDGASPTLSAEHGRGHGVPTIMSQAMAVRRLTPVECERLQGFPDNYTEIPWRGKAETPDGPRYKALGNSMAVPVMRWIGERINTRRVA